MAKEKLNWEDEQGRHDYRHTASHIMAQAVKRLWPETKLAIGPAIDNGFYYDFDSEHKFGEEDFMKIQKEMKKIVQANYPLERFELPREEAIKFMDALKLISIVTHVADAKSCVLHPASHTHRQLSEQQLREAGIAPDLIRLSVGIEDEADIIADLEQALQSLR